MEGWYAQLPFHGAKHLPCSVQDPTHATMEAGTCLTQEIIHTTRGSVEIGCNT